jgi:hypothetical protein
VATAIRPFIALHSAIEDVLRCSGDYVAAIRSGDLERIKTDYLRFEAAVGICARAKAAHVASIDCSGEPILDVLPGGIAS